MITIKKKAKTQGVFSNNQANWVNEKESWGHFRTSINFIVLNSQEVRTNSIYWMR